MIQGNLGFSDDVGTIKRIRFQTYGFEREVEETLSYILTSLHQAPRVFLLTRASLHSWSSLPASREVLSAPETWLLWAPVPPDAAEKGGGWGRI